LSPLLSALTNDERQDVTPAIAAYRCRRQAQITELGHADRAVAEGPLSQLWAYAGRFHFTVFSTSRKEHALALDWVPRTGHTPRRQTKHRCDPCPAFGKLGAVSAGRLSHLSCLLTFIA
jgi:hypothetical protein